MGRLIPAFLAKRSGALKPVAENQTIVPATPQSSGQGFRQRADECRRRAQNAKRPDSKERWLLVAENWTRLAQDAEAFRAAPGKRALR